MGTTLPVAAKMYAYALETGIISLSDGIMPCSSADDDDVPCESSSSTPALFDILEEELKCTVSKTFCNGVSLDSGQQCHFYLLPPNSFISDQQSPPPEV